MKAVLISIQPKWCELIASGKKTVEVRKTKPKIDVPFKCYIYETKDKKFENIGVHYADGSKDFIHHIGKVIGEFVCDAIFPISIWYSNPNDRLSHREYPFTCLTDKEIMDSLGNGVDGYGWHITDLVIYDKPRELSEFRRYVKDRCTFNEDGVCLGRNQNHVIMCDHLDCCQKEIKRPFQSWGYLYEVDT